MGTHSRRAASLRPWVEMTRRWPPREFDSIVALLPAHNEAADIATALNFLNLQSRRPDRVIVIANNCTDNTAEVAASCGAEVMVQEGNKHKKAGALNYALERVLPGLRDEDAVLVQDADSFLDPGFIAATARKLEQGFACGWR